MMSVCLKLKISVTNKPIEVFSLGNISTSPLVVLAIFWGVGTIPHPPKKYNPYNFIFFLCKQKVIAVPTLVYFLGNIPTGSTVVLSYFLGE